MSKILAVFSVSTLLMASVSSAQEPGYPLDFGVGTTVVSGQNQDGDRDTDIGGFVLLESAESGDGLEIVERGKIGVLDGSLYLELDARFAMPNVNVGPLHLVLAMKAVGRREYIRIDFPFVPRVGLQSKIGKDGRVGVMLIPLSTFGERNGHTGNMESGLGVYFTQPVAKDWALEGYSDFYATNGLTGNGRGHQLTSGFLVNLEKRVRGRKVELRGELRHDRTRLDGLELPSDGNGLEKDALSVFLSTIFH